MATLSDNTEPPQERWRQKARQCTESSSVEQAQLQHAKAGVDAALSAEDRIPGGEATNDYDIILIQTEVTADQ